MSETTIRLKDTDASIDILHCFKPPIEPDGKPKSQAQMYGIIFLNLIQACERNMELKDFLARKFARMPNGAPPSQESLDELTKIIKKLG